MPERLHNYYLLADIIFVRKVSVALQNVISIYKIIIIGGKNMRLLRYLKKEGKYLSIQPTECKSCQSGLTVVK